MGTLSSLGGLKLGLGGTLAESVDGHLVQLQLKSTSSRPSPPRLSPRWTWPFLEPSLPSPPPPTVGLEQKFVHDLEAERVKN